MPNWRIHSHSFVEHYQALRVNRLNRLSAEQNHRCAYCGCQTWNRQDEPAEWHKPNNRATIEHVKCVSHGGTWGWGNTVMACSRCNNNRGDMNEMKFFNLIPNPTLWAEYKKQEKQEKMERVQKKEQQSAIRRKAWMEKMGYTEDTIPTFYRRRVSHEIS